MQTRHDQGFNGLDGIPGKPRSLVAGLLTTTALLVATIIAATAVSAGIARADALGVLIDSQAGVEAGVFAIALLLGLLFVASCFTKAMTPRRNARRQALHDT